MNYRKLLSYSSFEEYHSYTDKEIRYFYNDYLKLKLKISTGSYYQTQILAFYISYFKKDLDEDQYSYNNCSFPIFVIDCKTEDFLFFSEVNDVWVVSYKSNVNDIIESYEDERLFSISTIIDVNKVLEFMDSVNLKDLVLNVRNCK